jgi:hypothetical protein
MQGRQKRGSTSSNCKCCKMHEWPILFYVRFMSSWISDIHSFITVENQTYVYMTFLTGNDLRILTYWHQVIGHPVCSCVCVCVFYAKCDKLGIVQNYQLMYEIWSCASFQFHYIRLVFLLGF